MVPIILNTQFQFEEGVPDNAIWKPNKIETFSCALEWDIIKQKKARTKMNTLIWHKYIPLEILFLIWRALKSKLLTNVRLTTFGVEPRNCTYYIRNGMNIIDHILVKVHFASHILKIFCHDPTSGP